jgi:nucleoside-diphosphate-sugar epimerase
MAFKPLPKADLEHILHHTEPLWRELRGSRLFITGGTGFFGKWLLETIAAANDALDAKVSAVVLTRSPERFAAAMPHLAGRPEFAWLAGDVVDFNFPPGPFDHIVHLATAASAQLNETQPLAMLDTIVGGTRRALDFARHCGARRFLLASSGAVYGPQPANLSHIPEDFRGGPDTLSAFSAYGEGKRMAELLCTLAPEMDCVIARCFAFIGPHLPLDAHFAAGNFLRDALAGSPIEIQGDGRALRSYLHAADLAVWLLTLLVRGRGGRAYNVGSGQAVTTQELARAIADRAPGRPEVRILGKPSGGPPHRYVPDISRAQAELGLGVGMDLDRAVARTLDWHLTP